MKLNVQKGLLFLISVFQIANGYRLDDLVHSLLDNYESAVRPNCDATEATDVRVDLALRQIIDLDEPRQILNTIIWIRLEWYDCRLKWYDTQYADIESIVLPQHRVWIPDITLYDNAANKLYGIDDFHLKIDQNGTVRYNFPSVIKSLCAVDVTHFPFDYQACRLEFGSWAQSGSQVNVQNSSRMADLTSYVENVEWYIKSAPVLRHETIYLDEWYPTIRLYILLERRPLFHVFNLLFPCLLITSVAMLGFLLPPVSGEKVNLEITVLLSLAVFQLIVLELMPPTGDTVPFIGIYFTISMVLVSLSCLATVTVLNIHFKGNGDTTIPRWLKVGFYIPLTKIMCMADVRKKWKYSSASIRYRNREHSRNMSRGYPELKAYKNSAENDRYNQTHIQESTAVSVNGNCHLETANGICMSDIFSDDSTAFEGAAMSHAHSTVRSEAIIDDIEHTIGDIDVQLLENKHASMDSSEWRIFSMMLDRLFMAVYVVFLVIISIALGARYIEMRDLPKLFTDLDIPDDLMLTDM